MSKRSKEAWSNASAEATHASSSPALERSKQA
jgi:hypothetical protein